MYTVLLAGILAFVFYFLFPLISAIIISRKWKQFRQSILGVSQLPVYSGQDSGKYRFYGQLRSIEEHSIWLKNEQRNIKVQLQLQSVYVFPETGTDAQAPPYTIQWKNIDSLAEGTKFFVAGFLNTSYNIVLFEATPSSPLVVIMYEGKSEDIPKTTIKLGRSRNAFWNSITVPLLLLGIMIEFLVLLNTQIITLDHFLTQVSISLIPFIILLPPGIYFFFLYRRFWNRGNESRIESDICAYIHSNDSSIYNKENEYRKMGIKYQTLAILFFALGIVLNLLFVNGIVYFILM